MIDQTGLPYTRVTSIDPANGANAPFSRVALIDPTTGNYIGAAGGHPGYPAGGGQFSTWSGALGNGAVSAADQIFLYPWFVPAPITFASALIRISTAGTGSSVKTAIWANGYNSASKLYRPIGAPLAVDNVGVATTAAATTSIAMAGSLTPQWVWIGTKHTGSPLPVASSIPSTTQFASAIMGQTASVLLATGIQVGQTYALDMPTFDTNSSFSVSGVVIPIIALVTAA